MANIVARVAKFFFGSASRDTESAAPGPTMPQTTNTPEPIAQPEGAAKLVDPAKVTPLAEAPSREPSPGTQSPANPLANRGAPGQGAPKSLRDSIPQTETLPPDRSKLPGDPLSVGIEGLAEDEFIADRENACSHSRFLWSRCRPAYASAA